MRIALGRRSGHQHRPHRCSHDRNGRHHSGLESDASTGNGIDVLGANNTQAFNLRLNDSDLEENVNMNSRAQARSVVVDNNDINTTGTDVAFALSGGSAQNGDVTIRNGNVFAAARQRFSPSITTSGTVQDDRPLGSEQRVHQQQLGLPRSTS